MDMWSISLYRPFGGLSARRITLFFSAILMALFASLTLYTSSVKAQEAPSMATWSGENLEYKEVDWSSSITLTKSATPENDKNIPDLNGTDCQDNPYIYYSSPGVLAGQDTAHIYIICLSSPFDGSDKTQPIPAMFLQYSAPPGTTDASKFGNPGRVSITIAPEGTDGQGNPIESDNTSAATTCDSKHTHGLGWIICPVTNWLADTMDLLYEALSSFLVVSPLSTDRDNFMYRVWDIMRDIANILFIFGFLIIIYSQTTSFGLSNYGLKRLLPRLIIAAVLVNVSYWIAALAIDTSNILGVYLKDTLDTIRDRFLAASSRDLSEWSWKAAATFILSSGTAGAFVGITAVAGVAASAGASLWFLLVGLAGVILAGLVAVLVLAARQALITILVILSPLAFVAYLLPSTEKYFERWKDLFMTLLLVYPIFSVVFGGANLAGVAIIQNADPQSANYFNIVILGMIVQVAPVVITPLLIKLSGSLIGRIAGMVNNPNRGLVDQTRKFAQSRHDMTKNRQMWDRDAVTGKYRNNNPLAAAARWNALREMDKSHKLKAYESGAEAAYAQDQRSHNAHLQTDINEMLKSAGTDHSKAAIAREIATKEALRRLYTEQQVNQEEAEHFTTQNKTRYEIGRTKPLDENNRAMQNLYSQAAELAENKRKETLRQSSITSKQEDDFYAALDRSVEMQEYAGAKQVDEYGDLRAKVTAQSKLMAASSERVGNYKKGFLFDNIDKDSVLEKAAGRNIANNEEWEAAINYVAESKDSDNIIKLSEQINLTAAPPTIRQTFEIAYKAASNKPIYATAGKLGGVAQGQGLRPDGNGHELINQWQIDAIEAGKYGSADLVQKASKEEIDRLTRVLREIKAANGGELTGRISADAIAQQKARIREVFKDPRINVHLGDNEIFLRQLGREFDIPENELRKPGI